MVATTARIVCLLALLLVGCCCAAPRAASSHGDVSGQIVGGHDADIADFPWQVSFRRVNEHFCGGSIINEYWILTAGHCVAGEDAPDAAAVTVRVGATTLSGEGGSVYQAEAIAPHPNFNYDTLQFDVGLVRLAQPLVLGDRVRPVRLAAAGTEPHQGETLTFAGWGHKIFSGVLSDTLQTVDLLAVDRASCAEAYADSVYRINATMICAGVSEGGKGHCQGDSGGALVDGEGVQVGVASWSRRCATPGYPSVYANVGNEEIHAWIVSQTSQIPG